MKLKHETNIYPAYDKRSPDPKKNYGIHCCEIRMVVKGSKGVVVLGIFTGWFFPEVRKQWVGDAMTMEILTKPWAFDIGYHSPKPHYEGQYKSKHCKFVKKGFCYYDGSSLAAEPYWDILLHKGSDAVWEALDKYYYEVFDKK